MKLFFFLALFLTILGASLAPAISFALIDLNLDYPEFGNITFECDPLPPGKVCGQNPNALIAWIYYFIVGIAGLAAFVMLVWGGVQWLTSGAIPSQAGEARDKIRNAILGLVLVLASFLVIQVINPELTILRVPGFGPAIGEVPTLPAGPATVFSVATEPGAYLCKQPGCVCAETTCVWTSDLFDPDFATKDALYLNPSVRNSWAALGFMHDRTRAVALVGDFVVVLTEHEDYDGDAICFNASVKNLDIYLLLNFSPWGNEADSAVVEDPIDRPCVVTRETKNDIIQVMPAFAPLI